MTAHVYTIFAWTLIYESGSRVDFVISPSIPFLKGNLQLCNIVLRKAKKEEKSMLLLHKFYTSINLWKQILKCLKWTESTKISYSYYSRISHSIRISFGWMFHNDNLYFKMRTYVKALLISRQSIVFLSTLVVYFRVKITNVTNSCIAYMLNHWW